MNKIPALICSLFMCLPSFCLDYDYTSTKCIPIYLSITEKVSTSMPIFEGQILEFKVMKTIYNGDNIVIKEGDIIKGRIDTIVTNGMNGFPAELIIDNFDIPNVKQSQLVSTYTKTGVNKSLWVYPLKWAMTPLYPAGSLTNFIRGGHAKIKPTDIITIYYYPEWQ